MENNSRYALGSPTATLYYGDIDDNEIEKITNYVNTHSYGSLESYAQYYRKPFSAEKKINSHRVLKYIDNWILDSGGFQIQQGKIKDIGVENIINLYHEYICSSDKWKKMFSLDVLKSTTWKELQNQDDIFKWNMFSYKKTAQLKEDIRKNIIYIDHSIFFPYNIFFDKIAKEIDAYNTFNHFSTGGVASLKGNNSIIIFSLIPLLKILDNTTKKNLTYHVLGNASPREMFGRRIVERHINQIYNKDVKITCDTSIMYKGFLESKLLYLFDTDIYRMIKISSENLENRMETSSIRMTVEEYVLERMKDLCRKIGIKEYNKRIYDDKTKELAKRFSTLAMFLIIDAYYSMDRYFDNIIEEIYSLYNVGKIESFQRRVVEISEKLTNNKRSNKCRQYSLALLNTLDIMKNKNKTKLDYIMKYIANFTKNIITDFNEETILKF